MSGSATNMGKNVDGRRENSGSATNFVVFVAELRSVKILRSSQNDRRGALRLDSCGDGIVEGRTVLSWMEGGGV